MAGFFLHIMIQALCNATVFTGREVLKEKAVIIENGFIKEILPVNDPSLQHARTTDLKDLLIAPGLIDLQIYGSGGKLFGGEPSPDALRQMENDLSGEGCTGFLATVATNSSEVVKRAIESAKIYRKSSSGNFLGLHLEGPYLNPQRRGAHPAAYMKKATLEEVKAWADLAEGEIRMMTIAPELQDEPVLEFLKDQGIVLSAGHSNASYPEALAFFSNSCVNAATHLYNAMPPMHHREPGMIPAIFRTRPFTSIVADGIHVSFPMVELAKRELGDRLFLITDSVTETREGLYPHVFKEDRYTMPDGTLSGSSLTMMKAVSNCVRHAGIPLEEALRMAAAYPAAVLGDRKRGYIAPGHRADLVVFNEQFEIKQSWLGGQQLF